MTKNESINQSILFAQFIAENHYLLVNRIGKIYYWKNEDNLKTTVQLFDGFKKELEVSNDSY